MDLLCLYRRSFIVLLSVVSISLCSCVQKKKGCTDAKALNFDLHAKVDDGSCKFPADPLPGTYFFDGFRSLASGGTGTIFRDSFMIVHIEGTRYKLQSLAWCDEIQVQMTDMSMIFLESNCNITEFASGIQSEGTFFMQFRKMEGSQDIVYGGDAMKVE